MKTSIFTLLIFIGFQSMMSCKSDDIFPTSPNKTEGKLNIPKLGPIISTPKPVTGSPSGARNSFEDESQPISDIMCTGLPVDNLTPGCPWVYEEDGIGWREITVVIPMPKNQVK